MCNVPLPATCNLQPATCNVRCTWRGTVWKSPRCLFAHLLRQSAWLTYDEVAHLMMAGLSRGWGPSPSSQPTESQSAFACSKEGIRSEAPAEAPTWPWYLQSLFVCCFVGDCFQITLNQKQMSEIFD